MSIDALPNDLLASVIKQEDTEDDPLLSLANLFSSATLDLDSPPLSMDIFPNELLAPILNHNDISLQERFKLRAVSSRWLTVIEEGLKKETTLDIIEVQFPPKEYEAKTLYLSDAIFLADLTQLFSRLFTGLENLTVNICTDEFEYGGQLGLTTAVFKGLSTLTQLVDLRLENFEYFSEYISLPLATDQPLCTVKRLYLKMLIDDQEEEEEDDFDDLEEWDDYFNQELANEIEKDIFNFKHLGKALTAWFPGLEQLTLEVSCYHYLDIIKRNLMLPSSVDVQIVVTGAEKMNNLLNNLFSPCKQSECSLT